MKHHQYSLPAVAMLLGLAAAQAAAQNTTVFLEDFGNSATRVPSIYVPQSGKDQGLANFIYSGTSFYTYADNTGSPNTYARAISDGFYAVIQPANIVSSGGGGWWANPGPDHTTQSTTRDGAVMVLNAGDILNQFYRRTFSAQPGASYRISAWRKSMTGAAAAASWRFEAQSVTSETPLGNSADIPNVAAKVWEQSSWEFQVPSACTGPVQVAVALRNRMAANGNNDILIDDILLEQIGSATQQIACPAETMSVVTAVDDAQRTVVNTPVDIPVTANDTASENGQFDYTKLSTTTPANGTVAVGANGVVKYTPRNNFVGTDTFKYTICNTAQPTPSCATANVTVTIATPDLRPQNDTASTAVGTAVTIAVLANDQADVGSPTLNGNVSTPAHGTAVIANGQIVYTPAAGYVGSDSFTYGVCDQSQPTAICKTATVTVTIGATLTAVADTATTVQGQPVTVAVLANDSAQAGPLVLDSIAQAPANGTAVPNGQGGVVYTPRAGFVGTDSFSYKVCDSAQPTAQCTVATVSVTVTAAGTTNPTNPTNPPNPTNPTNPTNPVASPVPVPGLDGLGLVLLSGLLALAGLARQRRKA